MKYAITKFRGEFLSKYDKECCGWSYVSSNAVTFDTYRKAYYTASRINKKYGRKVVRVERFNN